LIIVKSIRAYFYEQQRRTPLSFNILNILFVRIIIYTIENYYADFALLMSNTMTQYFGIFDVSSTTQKPHVQYFTKTSRMQLNFSKIQIY